jgi:hypothetical protein
VKNRLDANTIEIPAQAGIWYLWALGLPDPRLRGDFGGADGSPPAQSAMAISSQQ